MQEAIRKRYRNDAKAAFLTLRAKGTPDDSTVTCKVETGRGLALAGIHPKGGGVAASVGSHHHLYLSARAGRALHSVA